MGIRKATPAGVIESAEGAARRDGGGVFVYCVSLPAKYGMDAADRFPPELPGRFDDAPLRRQVDVFVDAAGLEWLRGDAAMYVDPDHFHAADLPDGLRASARVAVARLADPVRCEVPKAWLTP